MKTTLMDNHSSRMEELKNTQKSLESINEDFVKDLSFNSSTNFVYLDEEDVKINKKLDNISRELDMLLSDL